MDVHFETFKICDLGEGQKEKIKKFLIKVYSDNSGYINSVYTNRDLETCVLMFKDDELIGHVGITKRLVKHGDKKYLIAGIGDVAIKPGLQGKGLGKLLMKKANEVIKSQGYELGLLFCHPKLDSFYCGCGWIKKENGKILAFHHGILEDQRLSYLFPLNLNSEDKNIWDSEDINIGEGGW